MPHEDFTRQMQKATREVHALSDSLVNAKLSIALSNNKVWGEGLLVFYEIFRYLEEAMDRIPDTYVSDLYIEGMKRTKAFEDDLDFYLSKDWHKNYVPREPVAKYLLHLQQLEEKDPNLLMAYIYHLYMGLLTGGQILRKKRELLSNMFTTSKNKKGGHAITDYHKTTIYQIKRELKSRMNSIAEMLDDDTKSKLIEESKTVFLLNNELIRSVQGTYQVLAQKFAIVFLLVLALYMVYYVVIKILHD